MTPILEQCDNCGAEFTIYVTKQTSFNEKEEYYCPECNKRFETRASLPIKVNNNNLKPRTDGKVTKFINK